MSRTTRRPSSATARLTGAGALISALALVVTGCAADADQEPGAPVEGAEVTIGVPSDLQGVDGNLVGLAQETYVDAVFDTLIELDDDLEPQPVLAESWELSEDFTSISFELREDVTFHDGKQFTAEDVAYTLQRVGEPELGVAQLTSFGQMISEVHVTGDYSLEVQFSQPLSNIFDFLEILYIVDQENVEGPDANTTANGTGPYTLQEWIPEQQYVMERNDEYWGEEPAVATITAQVIADEQGRMAQLEAGQIDAMLGVPARELDRLEGQGMTVVQTAAAGAIYVGANVTSPKLEDPLVRRALSHAMDRERAVTDVMSGVGHATALPWPVESPAYDEELATSVEFDLDMARDLLDQAGVDDLALHLAVNGNQQEAVQFAQIYQADLATIGVTLDVEVVEVARWRETTTSYPELISVGFGNAHLTPSSTFLLTRPFLTEGGITNFETPEYASLVDNINAAAGDPEAVQAAYREYNEYFLEQSFVMPISTTPGLVAADSDLTGWGERRKNSNYDFRELSVTE